MDNQQQLLGIVMEKLVEQQVKIDKIFSSVEKTRKYFLLTLIITTLTVIVPLIGMVFAVPYIMNTFSSLYNPAQLNSINGLFK
jgi:hypothetical protein